MKLTSFNCTIEVSKDENGCPNRYYIDVIDKGVSISHPHTIQSQKQVIFVTKLIHDFIDTSIAFNNRIDNFNRDNHLEQYVIVTPPQVETAGSDFDLDAKSAATQSSRGVSKPELVAEQIGRDYEEAVKEKSLAKTIEDNVIESLGLK